MPAPPISGPFTMPDAVTWAELLRGLITVVYVAGLIATLYLAIKWFTGPRARTAPSWHLRFAGIALLSLVLLLLFETPIEALLTAAAKPLSQFATATAPNWPRDALIGIFRSIITTLGVVLAVQLIGRLYWRWVLKLQNRQGERDSTQAYWVVIGTMVLRVFRVAAILTVLLACLPLYLNYFPRSRLVLVGVMDYLGNPARNIAMAVFSYLPDLGYLVLIVILGRYSLKAIRYLFNSLESGALKIQGFHPEWALPSYRLSRTLFLLFLLMVSYPYLPGSRSQFFQGFSVFVGALITFGSSGAIGNIVAGTLLTYTGAFRLGDMVTIGEFTGIVIEKSLLVTRLQTPKNEEVSIPNSMALSGSVLNYSARAASEGLVLTVNAGISYDVDWRMVHRLMIEGALATEHILADPPPKVWQSELANYAVSYELRAATGNAGMMWDTYSTLRQNVLDAFNRAGIEIMTPSILAHRDASGLAVPVERFPDRGPVSGIAVDVRTRT